MTSSAAFRKGCLEVLRKASASAANVAPELAASNGLGAAQGVAYRNASLLAACMGLVSHERCFALHQCTAGARSFHAARGSCQGMHAVEGVQQGNKDDVLRGITHSPSSGSGDELKGMVEHARGRLHEFSAEELAQLATSLAEHGFYCSDFKNAVTKQVLERLQDFSPEATASILAAIAKSEYYDSHLAGAITQHVMNNVQRYSVRDLARVLWSWGKMGLDGEETFDIAKEVTHRIAQDPDPKVLAEVVRACAQTSAADSSMLMVVADQLAANTASFDAQDIAQVVNGLARLGFMDRHVYEAVARHVTDNISQFSTKELKDIVWACGEMSVFDRGMLDAVMEHVANHAGDVSPQDVFDIVQTCNKLGYSTPSVVRAAVYVDEHTGHLET